MRVKIEMFGGLKNPHGKNRFTEELEDSATVMDLLKKIGYKKSETRFLLVYRKKKKIDLEDSLKDGDSIKILVPFGGG